MFIHHVYFYLRKDLTEEEVESFKQGLAYLITSPQVKTGFFAKMVPSERAVVDSEFDFSLHLEFDSHEAHAIYQKNDPVHMQFIKDHKQKFDKVKVYDSERMS